MNMKTAISLARICLAPIVGSLLALTAHSATPGITGPAFNLTAQEAYLNQPDGASINSWGYG